MWKVILEAGFSREQKEYAQKGNFKSAGHAYDFVLTNFFGSRKLFHKAERRSKTDRLAEIEYKGINDDGYSCSVLIKNSEISPC